MALSLDCRQLVGVPTFGTNFTPQNYRFFTTSSIAVSVEMRYVTSHLLNVIGTLEYEIYIFAITGNNDAAFFSGLFCRTS